MDATLTVPSVEGVSPEVWRVARACSIGPDSATGQVLVRGEPADPTTPPHAGLAAARACAALAAQRAAAGDPEGQAAAVRAGLQALGRDYAPPGTKDDTKLKIAAAEDRIAQGFPQDGADNLLRALQNRIALYERRYASELAEPR